MEPVFVWWSMPRSISSEYIYQSICVCVARVLRGKKRKSETQHFHCHTSIMAPWYLSAFIWGTSEEKQRLKVKNYLSQFFFFFRKLCYTVAPFLFFFFSEDNAPKGFRLVAAVTAGLSLRQPACYLSPVSDLRRVTPSSDLNSGESSLLQRNAKSSRILYISGPEVSKTPKGICVSVITSFHQTDVSSH